MVCVPQESKSWLNEPTTLRGNLRRCKQSFHILPDLGAQENVTSIMPVEDKSLGNVPEVMMEHALIVHTRDERADGFSEIQRNVFVLFQRSPRAHLVRVSESADQTKQKNGLFDLRPCIECCLLQFSIQSCRSRCELSFRLVVFDLFLASLESFLACA